MNSNARAWIEALRSGKYRQGRGYLAARKANDSIWHCCLGVACELAVEAGVIKRPRINALGQRVYDGSKQLLPLSVRDWLGLVNGAGAFITPAGRRHDLVEMNDAGKDFYQIADLIEQEPSGLFKNEMRG